MNRPSRHSTEFRHSVVREVVVGADAIADVAARFGVAESTLAGWVEAYRRLYSDDDELGQPELYRLDTAFLTEALRVGDRPPGAKAAPGAGPDPHELDVLCRWLVCLRDPLIPVEPRLAAQSALLARYHDEPVRTGLVLAGVLTAVGDALRETAELIGWPPLEIDGRPALEMLSARVGGVEFGGFETPTGPVVDVLMGPPRIARVFPEPLTVTAWAAVYASAAENYLVSAGSGGDAWVAALERIHGDISSRLAAAHCALTGAYATGGALSATAAAVGASRWMLAANEVIGREWAPTTSRLAAAARSAVDQADRLLQPSDLT